MLQFFLELVLTFTLHVTEEKCRKESGKFCTSPTKFAQLANARNTVSTYVRCTTDPGKGSHYTS